MRDRWLNAAMIAELRARRHPQEFMRPSDRVVLEVVDTLKDAVETPRLTIVLPTDCLGEPLQEKLRRPGAMLRNRFVRGLVDQRHNFLRIMEPAIAARWQDAIPHLRLVSSSRVMHSALANESILPGIQRFPVEIRE